MKNLASAKALETLKAWLKNAEALARLKKKQNALKDWFKKALNSKPGQLAIEAYTIQLTAKERKKLDLVALRKELGKKFAKFESAKTHLELTVRKT